MLAEELPTFQKVNRILHGITQDFLDTGIAYYKSDWSSKDIPSIVQGVQVRSYLRLIAKQLKRPFVFAHRVQSANRFGHFDYIECTIPLAARTELLLATLLLVAQDGDWWDASRSGRDGVFRSHRHAKNIAGQFYFTGPKAQELFYGWRSDLAKDPASRICLGLNH